MQMALHSKNMRHMFNLEPRSSLIFVHMKCIATPTSDSTAEESSDCVRLWGRLFCTKINKMEIGSSLLAAASLCYGFGAINR